MKAFLREIHELTDGHGKVFQKVHSKLKDLGVEASVPAIRDFFSKEETPRRKHLVKEFVKLGYDPELGWVGNESFFKELGVSKEDFMGVAKALGEMVYEPEITEAEKCPGKKEEDEEYMTGGEKMVVCPICKRDVPEEDIQDHLEEHEMKKKQPIKKMRKTDEDEEKSMTLNVRCPICKSLVSKDDFEEHMEEHETKEKQPIKKMRKEDE